MAKKKNWSKSAWGNADEGSLRALGWPDATKLVNAARKDRKKVEGKLLLLANANKNAATAAKAKAIIKRIQRELGKS